MLPPLPPRRLRLLRRKYEQGTLSYRQFVELLTRADGESAEDAALFYVSYLARHRPGHSETFLF